MLASSVVSTRGKVRAPTIEYIYSHTNKLCKELTVHIENLKSISINYTVIKVFHDLGDDAHIAHCLIYPFPLNDVRARILKLIGHTDFADVAAAYVRIEKIGCTVLRYASYVGLGESCCVLPVSAYVDGATFGRRVVVDSESELAQAGVVNF